MTATVCVVGGYGVVGARVCELLAERHPDLHVVVAGRDPARAAEVASRLPSASTALVDVLAEDPLADLAVTPDVVVAAADDPADRLLRAAVRRGVALVDPARPIHRVDAAKDLWAAEGGTAPVLLPVGWCASAAAVTVAALLESGDVFSEPRPVAPPQSEGLLSGGSSDDGPQPALDLVEVDVLVARDDVLGPAGAARLVDVHRSFAVWDHGRRRLLRGLADPHVVRVDGRPVRTRRFSSAEQDTLVEAGYAGSVAVRLSPDTAGASAALSFLVGSGAWAWLPRAWRRGVLHHEAAAPAPHRVVVTLVRDDELARVDLLDPLGRAHLATVGTVGQVERALGLAGRTPPPPGVTHPEQADDVARDLALLRENGVEVQLLRAGSAG